jgi:uncharacterized membrane protein
MKLISDINQGEGVGIVKAFISLAFVFFCLVVALHFVRPPGFGTIDFVQYWTAARLVLQNQDPYNPALVDQMQVLLGVRHHPVLMWNPPHIIPLIVWLGMLPFEWATDVWLVLALVLFVLALIVSLALTYGTNRSALELLKKPVIFGYVFSLYPLFLMLSYGQISFLLLIGLVGYLALAIRPEQAPRSHVQDTFWGGVVLTLTSIKAHVLWLVYLSVILNSMFNRRYKTFVGLSVCVALMMLVSIFISPDIIQYYMQAWHQSPIYWKTPTVGSWLQGLTGIHTLWMRALPTILVSLIAISWWIRRAKKTNDCDLSLEMLLGTVPLSLVFSPYGWVYDQLLLLPSGIWLSSKDVRLGLLLILSNVFMLSLGSIGQEWMVWYPLVYWLGFAFFR